MMTRVGDEMQNKEKIIPTSSKTINLEALDICMAPGGYSATVLKYNRLARISGLSLPKSEGGHDILLPKWQVNRRINIEFMDITMLAAEIGFPHLVSQEYTDASKFSDYIPYESQAFDIAFCDGQVLHTHTRVGGSRHEPARLTAAQLTIALRRIKRGGTLIVLLHQVYSPPMIRLLESFSQFSKISLFKPTVSHAHRSSFYLVAKDVDSGHERASDLLRKLRNSWRISTVQSFNVTLPDDSTGRYDAFKTIEEVMQLFGDKLIVLAEPVWNTQKQAMEKKFLASG
jgi:23S rRNA U2552 (ribose-2'-O)-methylase RlmE/FtsJ